MEKERDLENKARRMLPMEMTVYEDRAIEWIEITTLCNECESITNRDIYM